MRHRNDAVTALNCSTSQGCSLKVGVCSVGFARCGNRGRGSGTGTYAKDGSEGLGGIQELCAHACLMHEHTGERWSLYCAGAVRMSTFHAHEGSFILLLHWVGFASPSGSSVVTAPL